MAERQAQSLDQQPQAQVKSSRRTGLLVMLVLLSVVGVAVWLMMRGSDDII